MTPLVGRMLLGALAGFAATLPMTGAMRRMHEHLPRRERYPLPPREIVEDLPDLGLRPSTATLLHHFLYGAAAGSVLAAASTRRDAAAGGVFGLAVWAASYLGWIPAMGILRFGARHPARRNGLMLAAHLVWGACLAAGLRELETARGESFAHATALHPSLEDRREDRT